MTADLIISQLLFLDAEDPKKDITLFINSPGGSVTAGMFVHVFSTCLILAPLLFVALLCFLFFLFFICEPLEFTYELHGFDISR